MQRTLGSLRSFVSGRWGIYSQGELGLPGASSKGGEFFSVYSQTSTSSGGEVGCQLTWDCRVLVLLLSK